MTVVDSTLSFPPMAVGRYIDAAGARKSLPFSLVELERARVAALRVLSTFHFRTGTNVLLTAMWDECAQLQAVERAIMSYGMVAVSAEASIYDAMRVASIIRRFQLVAAVGITPGTLEGLVKLGHNPAELFANMVIWARPGAYEQLRAHEHLDVHYCTEVGPAIAMECKAKAGAHIDRYEWLVEEEGGEVVLSSRLERSKCFSKFRTGVYGKVIHGVCDCGNPDPRVILDPAKLA